MAEDTARGTRIGALKASDADAGANGQVSFSLLSDWGNELFALNPHTGEFTLTASLDYEQVRLRSAEPHLDLIKWFS